MLVIFSSPPFYTTYIQLPSSESVSHKIQHNPKFWPFFQDAIGAIDGSHIHTAPPAFVHPNYRNRKGFVSQNCLFACDFDLKFVYLLMGWEGSATDAHIYADAIAIDLCLPDGKYFLHQENNTLLFWTFWTFKSTKRQKRQKSPPLF